MRIHEALLALLLTPAVLHAQAPLFEATANNGKQSADTPVIDLFDFESPFAPFGPVQSGRVTSSTGRLQARMTNSWSAGSAGAPNSNTGTADMTFYDVIFSSPTAEPVSGSMIVTLEGTVDQIFRYLVNISAAVNNQFSFGTFSDGVGLEASGTGLLAGYGGGTSIMVSVPFSEVPTNTPVPVFVRLQVNAQSFGGGTATDVDYGLSLGGSGGDVPVFVLPNGVSADSSSANVEDNGWSAPEDLMLAVSPESPATAGETIEVVAWNGQAGAPVALFFTEGNGTPILVNTSLFGFLGSDGLWSTGQIPTPASLVGKSFGLTAYSLYGGPTLVNSQQVVVDFE